MAASLNCAPVPDLADAAADPQLAAAGVFVPLPGGGTTIGTPIALRGAHVGPRRGVPATAGLAAGAALPPPARGPLPRAAAAPSTQPATLPLAAPLAGTLVLDMSTYVAAPSVGALLYDLGADVVKMEPPAGDGRRSALTQVAAGDPPGLNRPFHMDNRGKWSVTVALDDANGLALARRLIARADIVIGNMPPPRQRRFRLAGDDILAINPRAVCVQLTAYGTTGPDADQSGFDIQAFFARSGITGVLARQADEPPRSRSGQGDHVTTLVLLSGLFAALHARERSGRGQLVETSLLAAGAFTIGADLLLARAGLAVEPVHPLASCYRCADGRWLHVGVAEPDRGQAWDALRAGAGVDGAAALAAFVAARPLAAATAALKALSVPAAPVQALPDVVRDPQVLANDMLMAIEHPRHGTIRCVAPPYRIDGIGQRPPQPGPEIGEHTDAVLARCGLSAAEIAALRAAGTLG